MKKQLVLRIIAAFAAVLVITLLTGYFEIGMAGVALAFAAPSFVKSSKKLKEERAEKHNELQAIIDACKAESRDLNKDEVTQYEQLREEIRALDDTIEATEEYEETQRKAAARKIAETQKKKEIEEKRNYSFLKGIRSIVANKPLDGYEAEMDQEARTEAERAGVQPGGNGLMIPRMILDPNPERRDMTAGTATQGGNAIATGLGDFINYLWDTMVLSGLGTTFLSGLIGNLDMPKETAVPSGTWEGETDENAESNPTVGKISFTPKRLGTFVDLSQRLLIQTSPSIEARVRSMIVKALQIALETAAINGSGVAPIPTGILNTAGIGSVTHGANGGAPDWNTIVNLETEVSQDNADIGSLGYLANAKTRGFLKRAKIDAGSGQFIWDRTLNELNGYRAAVTNLVPSTLTKGDGENLSALIFGNFSDLVVATWGGMEILVDPYTNSKNALVTLVANMFADTGVLHAESFAVAKDLDLS